MAKPFILLSLSSILIHGPCSFIRMNVILPHKPELYVNSDTKGSSVMVTSLSNPKNYIF